MTFSNFRIAVDIRRVPSPSPFTPNHDNILLVKSFQRSFAQLTVIFRLITKLLSYILYPKQRIYDNDGRQRLLFST